MCSSDLQINGRRIGLGVVRLDQHIKLAAVVQLYAQIIDADAVFVVFENDSGDHFIIGRSKSPDIDVRVVLAPFGGGGHAGAGSATVARDAGNTAPAVLAFAAVIPMLFYRLNHKTMERITAEIGRAHV